MNITATIITLNEEEHIAECIRSAKKVCNEIVVVDSNSSDNTVKIAESLGAKVVLQDFLGDGQQKDFCVQFASNDWILSIDADERLGNDMIDDIKQLDLTNSQYDAYSFRRKSFIGDRWQKLWYPDNVIRLYNKNRCRYIHRMWHAYVDTKNVCRLNSHIIHYSYKNLSHMAKTIDKYSYGSAKILYKKKKHVTCFTPVLRGMGAFLKKYILKRGIFMGLDGLTISVFSGFNTYLKYAMLIEMYNEDKKQKK